MSRPQILPLIFVLFASTGCRTVRLPLAEHILITGACRTSLDAVLDAIEENNSKSGQAAMEQAKIDCKEHEIASTQKRFSAWRRKQQKREKRIAMARKKRAQETAEKSHDQWSAADRRRRGAEGKSEKEALAKTQVLLIREEAILKATRSERQKEEQVIKTLKEERVELEKALSTTRTKVKWLALNPKNYDEVRKFLVEIDEQERPAEAVTLFAQLKKDQKKSLEKSWRKLHPKNLRNVQAFIDAYPNLAPVNAFEKKEELQSKLIFEDGRALLVQGRTGWVIFRNSGLYASDQAEKGWAKSAYESAKTMASSGCLYIDHKHFPKSVRNFKLAFLIDKEAAVVLSVTREKAKRMCQSQRYNVRMLKRVAKRVKREMLPIVVDELPFSPIEYYDSFQARALRPSSPPFAWRETRNLKGKTYTLFKKGAVSVVVSDRFAPDIKAALEKIEPPAFPEAKFSDAIVLFITPEGVVAETRFRLGRDDWCPKETPISHLPAFQARHQALCVGHWHALYRYQILDWLDNLAKAKRGPSFPSVAKGWHPTYFGAVLRRKNLSAFTFAWKNGPFPSATGYIEISGRPILESGYTRILRSAKRNVQGEITMNGLLVKMINEERRAAHLGPIR